MSDKNLIEKNIKEMSLRHAGHSQQEFIFSVDKNRLNKIYREKESVPKTFLGHGWPDPVLWAKALEKTPNTEDAKFNQSKLKECLDNGLIMAWVFHHRVYCFIKRETRS